MEKLEAGKAIVTWLERTPLSGFIPTVEDYQSMPLVRRYLARGGTTTSPSKASVFDIKDAFEAVLEYRETYGGSAITQQMDVLGYFPSEEV